MDSTVKSNDGTTIAYETTGSGPPLVLVDGALCYRDCGPSRPLAEQLAADFTVVTYGRGESGDGGPYAVEREVEDLEALIEAAVMQGTQDGRPLPAGRWSGVTVPTLVVAGGKSDAWMHHGQRALADALPNVRLETLEGQNHMVKPKALAPMLAESSPAIARGPRRRLASGGRGGPSSARSRPGSSSRGRGSPRTSRGSPGWRAPRSPGRRS